ncbi:hypothetical protein [Desulfosporosinus nitroreducens]|uniref:hypothetical protein n=1 Tax=Desulfosporosinus nitroreducens TaxID=2018668 RepID=UPI00207C26A2|nr:hypothetical protein [Desulfosporosinus nitroreducens]MCO1599790.1 hypothetical protein [Desulfosporosinus nitroreducens]
MDNDKEWVIEASYEESKKELEYIELINTVICLGKKIMALLGPNNRLFLEYEKSVCAANDINMRRAYYLGHKKSCPTKCPTEYTNS